MTGIYLVIKTGFYRHEILGAYIFIEDAKKRAEALAKEEQEKHDGYHDYHVEFIQVNTNIEDSKLMGYYDCEKEGVIWKNMS